MCLALHVLLEGISLNKQKPNGKKKKKGEGERKKRKKKRKMLPRTLQREHIASLAQFVRQSALPRTDRLMT